jgi:iron complex transport system ATP-binding protein
MSDALVFDNVVFGYPGGGDTPVLRGLSLSAPPGRITALLGPNGVGKTTLLGLALGWLQPENGTVSLFGEPISRLTRGHLGRTVALVPQSEYIPFEFTVAEYALLGRAPYLRPLEIPKESDLQIVRTVLEEVGIHHLRERSVTELSAGERQLLLLARALVQEPEILLLDEPSSHLDLANKQRLLEILKRRLRRGLSAVLTSHDPHFAAALATKVCLLEGGRAFAAGSPLEILTPANLRRTYGVPVDVRVLDGEPVILWHRQGT